MMPRVSSKMEWAKHLTIADLKPLLKKGVNPVGDLLLRNRMRELKAIIEHKKKDPQVKFKFDLSFRIFQIHFRKMGLSKPNALKTGKITSMLWKLLKSLLESLSRTKSSPLFKLESLDYL